MAAITVVYADTYFIINAAADYLILLATAVICAVPASRLRLVCSAIFGGAYSAASLYPALGFLGLWPFKLAAAAVMLLAVFYGEKRIMRIAVVFSGVAACFGGAVYAFSLDGGVFSGTSLYRMALIFAASWVAVSVAFARSGKSRTETARLDITRRGRTVTLTALIDTGNSLADPMTGKPVAVADVKRVFPLFEGSVTRELAQLCDIPPPDMLERLLRLKTGDGFRLLPYSSVGTGGGLLLAFRPDDVRINGRTKNGMLIALCPDRVSDGGAYSALVGALGGNR